VFVKQTTVDAKRNAILHVEFSRRTCEKNCTPACLYTSSESRRRSKMAVSFGSDRSYRRGKSAGRCS
jgi:hypothetical protein